MYDETEQLYMVEVDRISFHTWFLQTALYFCDIKVFWLELGVVIERCDLKCDEFTYKNVENSLPFHRKQIG